MSTPKDELTPIERQAIEQARQCRAKWGAFASLHEAESVLREECREFEEEVFLKEEERSPERIRRELIDIAAVAIRAAEQFGAPLEDVEQLFGHIEAPIPQELVDHLKESVSDLEVKRSLASRETIDKFLHTLRKYIPHVAVNCAQGFPPRETDAGFQIVSCTGADGLALSAALSFAAGLGRRTAEEMSALREKKGERCSHHFRHFGDYTVYVDLSAPLPVLEIATVMEIEHKGCRSVSAGIRWSHEGEAYGHCV